MKRTCQICGLNKELTREHLPQRSFYPKKIRSQIESFNTVLACSACNNDSNVSDELAKVVFGLVASVDWKYELRQSIDSTLSKNQRLGRLLEENTRTEKIRLENGDVEHARAFKLPQYMNEELFSSVKRMVKAFYFMQFGRVLVNDYELSEFHPDAVHPSLAEKIRSGVESAVIHGVNGDTVLYTFFNPQGSDWVCVVNLFKSVQLYFVMKKLGWRDKAV